METVVINKLTEIPGMLTIRQIASVTGWSDAYIRELNTEIRRAGHWLIGTHYGLFLSSSLADCHYQAQKFLGQAKDMSITADAMLHGRQWGLEEMSEDARRLYSMYTLSQWRGYEFPEQKTLDFIEVRDGDIV